MNGEGCSATARHDQAKRSMASIGVQVGDRRQGIMTGIGQMSGAADVNDTGAEVADLEKTTLAHEQCALRLKCGEDRASTWPIGYDRSPEQGSATR